MAHFHYEHSADWIGQFVDRPHPVREIRLAHDVVALVENVSETRGDYSHGWTTPVDRLQWLACPRSKMIASIAHLNRMSRISGRHFFMYTTDPIEAQAAKRAGLRIVPGYLMILPIDEDTKEWRALAATHWHVQSGDRL